MFEEFIKEEKANASIPVVIFDKRGKITFNTSAVKKFEIGYAHYVKIFFDKDTNTVGFKFFEKEIPMGLKILTANGTYVYSKAFMNKYGLIFETNRRFPLEYNKKEKMYTAIVSEPKPKIKFKKITR